LEKRDNQADEASFVLPPEQKQLGQQSFSYFPELAPGVGNAVMHERDNASGYGVNTDCAGRASARSGAATEEAALVMQSLDATFPLLGFYSGVEIAPFGGYSRALDWTGVLTLLRQAP